MDEVRNFQLQLPSVVSAQGVTEAWQARADWVAADGGVAIDMLVARFGDACVTAVDAPQCGACACSSFNESQTWQTV